MDTIRESWIYKFSETIGVLIILPQTVFYIVDLILNGFFHAPVYQIIILVQILELILLTLFLYEAKCKLSLIETLENNDRANLISAIQMFLNKDKDYNSFLINKATLNISVVEDHKSYDDNDLCDLKFEWVLEGKNNTNAELDKFYFRLATVAATTLTSIGFTAKQVLYDGAGQIRKIKMEIDEPDVNDKSNMFILPLLFDRHIAKNEKFRVETSHICPRCFIQKQDWLVIAPFNFSKKPLESFEINIYCGNDIITKGKYFIRLYSLLIKSPLRRDFKVRRRASH